MGCLSYPQVKMYWDPKFRIPVIGDNMTLKRFFKLRHHIHVVNDNPDPSVKDRIWKVRPINNCIRSRCWELELEANLCINEQIIHLKDN